MNNVKNTRIFDPNNPLSQHTRLAIMIILVSRRKIVFSELQRILQTTSGNIASHLMKLEHKGYVKINKEFVRNAPRSIITITKDGYTSTILYILKLRNALDEAIQHRYHSDI